MNKKNTEPAENNTGKVEKPIIWTDPLYPLNKRRFSTIEERDNFIKWREDHKDYFQDVRIDQIIDLMLKPFEDTTEAHQKDYREQLKILYAKKLEGVNDPLKRKTFEAILSGWDNIKRADTLVIYMNELKVYLQDIQESTKKENTIRSDIEQAEADYKAASYQALKEKLKNEKTEEKSKSTLTIKKIKFDNIIFSNPTHKNILYELINHFGIKNENGEYLLTQEKKVDAAELIVAIFEYLYAQEMILNYVNKKGDRQWINIIPYFTHISGDKFTSKELSKAKDKILDPTSKEIDEKNKYIKTIREQE